MNEVHISEVGPRDGLQSVARTMATEDKCRWIAALHAAGVKEIEVGSFVPARLLPQMADAAEVVRQALSAYVNERNSLAPASAALDAVSDLVGCFSGGPADLASNPAHLADFGQR